VQVGWANRGPRYTHRAAVKYNSVQDRIFCSQGRTSRGSLSPADFGMPHACWRLAPVVLVLVVSRVAGDDLLQLNVGDVYTGTFESAGGSQDNQWELRVHSPITGSVEWLSALGSRPWYELHPPC
jgi:hypothetical protein